MSSSSSELFDTETPQGCATLCSQEFQTPKIAFGKLIATTVYLPSIVLDKPEFILGRALECDVILTRNNFSRTGINSISKQHFKITCHSEKSVVSITDLSKNGTYINEKLVGKNNKNFLNHNDIISIGTPDYKVYKYKKTDGSNDVCLPVQLKDRYEFKRSLGTGACGEVILVREMLTQTDYAVKKISKGRLSQKDNLNNPLRIKNEVDIMLSLSHPSVLSAKEVIEDQDTVYIVLEYMGGGELTDLITSPISPLPENIVKLLFYQIVLGLRYLHLSNITHRDLKPSNILLQSNSVSTIVKIADFGLSKIMDTYSDLNTCCGTPCYIAPEIVDSGIPYTQQVDVWSLGVILFYMLSSELPFQGNHQRAILRLVSSGDYSMTSPVWNSVSLGAKDLITKMLRKNPDERYTIHEVANHPWLSTDTVIQQQYKELLEKYRKQSNAIPGQRSDELPPPKKLKID